MKMLRYLALSVALTASSAFANGHLDQVAAHARELAADYKKMVETLRNKNFPVSELRQELQDAEEALAKVKDLLAEFQAANPGIATAQPKDWKLTQDLVTLLDIFHDRKAELLSGDNPWKKRTSIRNEAQGLVTRATMLEQAVLRLARSVPVS
jgi:cell division septum initiation protein DivIVA